jgi:hypothetical protein
LKSRHNRFRQLVNEGPALLVLVWLATVMMVMSMMRSQLAEVWQLRWIRHLLSWIGILLHRLL